MKKTMVEHSIDRRDFYERGSGGVLQYGYMPGGGSREGFVFVEGG